MAALSSIRPRIRALGVGYPKSGKTPSLAALANAGYNLRIMDYDGHAAVSLAPYLNADARARVDIVTLEDDLSLSNGSFGAKGTPSAYVRGANLVDRWKDGDTDLGPIKGWTDRDVLVLDTLTDMGEAAIRYVKHLNPAMKDIRRIVGKGQEFQQGLIESVTHSSLPCHVIVFSHLVMIGPELPNYEKDEANDSKELKLALAGREAQMIPFKLWPSALGRKLPTNIGGKFPIQLYYTIQALPGNRLKRVIRTVPADTVDAGVQAPNLPAELSLDDGLLKVFEAVAGPLSTLPTPNPSTPTT